MTVTTGSNISSIQAQRRLSESSSTLSKTFERLSSGQRINRASDDAAGLAVADALRVGSRISTQGVRNLNDSVSYYAIMEGATRELKNIIIRGKELAEQSANGVYSGKQRTALDSEVQSLGQEYNRILQSTSFNGRNVFERDGRTLISQAGDCILSTSLNSARASSLDTISRVSMGPDGAQANGGSVTNGNSSLSADGRYAVFRSSATNLVAGVSGQQIYRKDLQTGEIRLVSSNSSGICDSSGTSEAASLSADGRYAVFTSSATNLVSGISGSQIYRKDLETGEIRLVSVNSAGITGALGVASLSADGRYVAFNSMTADMVSGVSGNQQIYRKDLQTGEILLVSANSSGTAGAIGSGAPTLSADGRYAVFTSPSTNLVPGVSGSQIYRKDLETGTITVVSSNSAGTAGLGGGTSSPTLSADGRYAAFRSNQTNLVSGVSGDQIYRKNLDTGEISVVSSNSSGIPQVEGASGAVSLSADGRYAVFGSGDSSLVAGIPAGHSKLFVKDMETGEIRCVSLSQSGRAPSESYDGSGAFSGQISADGRYIFFDSDFNDQLDGPLSGDFHVYFTSNTLAQKLSLTRFQWVNIKTQSEAGNALGWFDSYLNELNTFQGDLGSSMSRLDVAKNVLSSMNENFRAAESRIRDADIAEESATLVKSQILQQVASSVLAQANQLPALAIGLLRGG